MKTPICSVCTASNILCSGCGAKLKEGKISDGDVKLARALIQLSGRYSFVENSEFTRTLSYEGLFLIFVPKGAAGAFIGRKGVFIKELSDLLEYKRIKVVEETKEPRELIKNILYPTQLLGVNVVYSGEVKSYKIRVGYSRAVADDKKVLEGLFEKLIGAKAEIVFERS